MSWNLTGRELLHEPCLVEVEYSDMSVMSWNLTGLYCHMNPVLG
jgi:hypothetical protein